MNGLGNEFAVIDARSHALRPDAALARRLADPRTGPGCDQVIVLEPSARASVFMRVLNADGSEVDACGNATRCVAGLLAGESGRGKFAIETGSGLLLATVNADGSVTADMGRPRFGWEEIPLSRPFADTTAIDFTAEAGPAGRLRAPAVVNVGNPHCIFWVEEPGAYDLAEIGPRIEHDPLFPQRVNVSLAQILSRDSLRLAVWERGTGLTKACGTAACAAAVAAARKDLTERNVMVTLPGGNLRIEWRSTDDHILMTGPWELDYEGVFELERPARIA